MSVGHVERKIIAGLRVRKLDGKLVKPILYNGRAVGHGKFFAASIDGEMLLDETGKPIPILQAGTLEDA